MKSYRLAFIILVAACALVPFMRSREASSQAPAARSREDAYRANNLGVALLEQYKHKEGADQFRRALALDPKLALARINLAIALFNVPDLPGAQKEAEAAAAAAPNAPQPQYILGLIARQQNRIEDAVAAFQRVLKTDPRDVGANVQLGQLYAQQRKYAEAVAAFRIALAEEPYNGTALYNLGTALLRSGQRDEGQRLMQQFQALRQSGAATTIGQNYLEQGRYAEAVASTGAEADVVDKRTPEVNFADATSAVLPTTNETGAPLLFDFDNDGDLDLFAAAGRKLLRNDGGKFADVTAQAGLSSGAALGAVAGDYDNDEKPDLLVVAADSLILYRGEGGLRFKDATAAAKLTARRNSSGAAAFVDSDHDGDLDIFLASGLLLRNNGDGTFADVTAAAKLTTPQGRAVAVVPTDYDNRRDVDLLVVGSEGPPALWKNLRDGTFRNVAAEAGLELKGGIAAVAAGDVNKDGFTDFYFGRADGGGEFATSDGRGRFRLAPAPAGSAAQTAAQFLDYDNDGLLDLVTVSSSQMGGGMRLLRNTGDGWADVSEKASRGLLVGAHEAAQMALASGDVDGDNDVDIIVGSGLQATAGGRLIVSRNEGGSRNRSVRVQLAGKVSNRSGVGSKIELRAGSLQQKLETYSASPAPAPADVVFGLGQRASADAVRILWPSGVVQAETQSPGAKEARVEPGTLKVTELDRKPSSCPFLYTWNGERFEFVTDFMGGGEMGGLVAPGLYNTPDPDEFVRISGDQLKPKDGRYELRVTNELEEALFVDRLELLTVAHPEGVEVYPDEGMRDAPPAFKLYKVKGARPPAAATDEHGHDVLDRVARIDRTYPDDFQVRPIRGYAEPHTLTLDLGRGSGNLLLLTGWTDYAFSSDNVAASHGKLQMKPPSLQVKDRKGKWRTVIGNMGFPVGRPQTLVVDLTGKFLSASREVRVVTNMRVYWDRVQVGKAAGDSPVRLTRSDPTTAELRWRGFSAELKPDGREPLTYDYARVSLESPWKAFPGRYTREGDVRELLRTTDDIFVVSRAGDEISLSFDASELPPLPDGWTRTFLLYASGFSKEMNIHSSSPDVLAPLPYHGMKSYPDDAYELTAERMEYIERYNTRVVARTLPTLVAGWR
ncbi:MAG TPA: FG-GAP-like repeat-containing protein [Pyrinomonadaceae bacterium]|jgi:tetratricopeptide (TPR) repeat protein|nr:FG-GAP-like repeat-containing protein [Pyrinomonadaceae bacterium]